MPLTKLDWSEARNSAALAISSGSATATTRERQHVMRASRELGADRLDTTVGPLTVKVVRGLRELRLRLAANDGELELDVAWVPSIPAFLEARHVNRRGARVTTDTSRFAQTGFWTGTLRVGSATYEVERSLWRGGRDRSWGIRPVVEPEPVVRRVGEEAGGFLWLYYTMQFTDFTIVCTLLEDQHGQRTRAQAARVWTDPDRQVDQLGRIEHEIVFVGGTRRIEHLGLRFRDSDGDQVLVEAEPIGANYLSIGTGYGTEPGWRHGMYQGPLEVQHLSFDLTDPTIIKQSYGLVDNVARYTLDEQVRHGLLENAVLGPNDRYGFGRH